MKDQQTLFPFKYNYRAAAGVYKKKRVLKQKYKKRNCLRYWV